MCSENVTRCPTDRGDAAFVPAASTGRWPIPAEGVPVYSSCDSARKTEQLLRLEESFLSKGRRDCNLYLKVTRSWLRGRAADFRPLLVKKETCTYASCRSPSAG